MDEWDRKIMSARDYIESHEALEVRWKSMLVDLPPTETPLRLVLTLSRDLQTPTPPPIDTRRRSSGKTRDRVREHSRPRSSGKERKGSIEIVEPAGRGYEARKIPSMPTSSSSPANIKVPVNPRSAPQPHRSSTMQVCP
jgi:hypothetical protein